MATMKERQREVQLYRGQIPSPGRPTVAWRQDRVNFWAAISRGAKTEEAAVEAGVSSPVAFRWFRHSGGVNPCLPATVSGRFLSFSEREDIALFRAQGAGVREIARQLGRSPSTISRELRRNASTRTFRLEYKATIAQWHAERRACRPKVAKLAMNDRLRAYVQERLSGEVRGPDRHVLGPEGPEWKGRNKPHRGDRRWVQGWSPDEVVVRRRAWFGGLCGPWACRTRTTSPCPGRSATPPGPTRQSRRRGPHRRGTGSRTPGRRDARRRSRSPTRPRRARHR
jgi:transposase-like protein